jgi:hypothetical protein
VFVSLPGPVCGICVHRLELGEVSFRVLRFSRVSQHQCPILIHSSITDALQIKQQKALFFSFYAHLAHLNTTKPLQGFLSNGKTGGVTKRSTKIIQTIRTAPCRLYIFVNFDKNNSDIQKAGLDRRTSVWNEGLWACFYRIWYIFAKVFFYFLRICIPLYSSCLFIADTNHCRVRIFKHLNI